MALALLMRITLATPSIQDQFPDRYTHARIGSALAHSHFRMKRGGAGARLAGATKNVRPPQGAL